MTAGPHRDAENEVVERMRRISATTTAADHKAVYGSDARAVNEWLQHEERREVSAFVQDETESTYHFLMGVVKYAILPVAVIATVGIATLIGILIVRVIP